MVADDARCCASNAEPSEVDENEDGARANIIEEGISTWIFNHGLRQSEFRTPPLDYGLLKAA